MLALAQDIAVDASFLHRSVVADDTAADIAHDVRYCAVAVDDAGDAGIFDF